MAEKTNLTVLVAPLDWGLGHATRCVPVINYLLSINCNVIIAAERKQEILLKTEFPFATFVNISGYRISYTKFKRFFFLNIALQIPKILRAISKEKKWLYNFLLHHQVDAIISDNRYGMYHSKIPSVFITHQLHITTSFSLIENILEKINCKLVENFSSCWIPDEKGAVNLAGILSHPAVLPNLPVTYIGGLSRLNNRSETNNNNILIILSGPEPQRTVFENIILDELKNFRENVKLVRGIPGNPPSLTNFNKVKIINHLPAAELEKAFSESKFIISRSGYTTVMDIFKMRKKSILVPTPGQTEQEYLAKHLQKQGWCITTLQENFSLKELLSQAQNFDYEFPELNMEFYKEVIDNWVGALQKAKYDEKPTSL